MHTVAILEQALDLATRLGYAVRQEWLAGSGGGGCELNGQKIFFLDLALDPSEQLDQLLDVLRHDPEAANLPIPHELRSLLQIRKSA